MPSQPHELILMLFRSPSALFVRTLEETPQVKVPKYRLERIDSADLTDLQPAEYRADLVVTLVTEDGSPAMSVIVEAQLQRDDRKRYVWPAYAANLRVRLQCPVCVLVVTLDDSVARWAAQPIDMGGESRFVPLVLGPAQIAHVTDPDQACELPELAVLSAMAHGRHADIGKAVEIARAALHACEAIKDADRAVLYRDIVYASLSEEARQEVRVVEYDTFDYDAPIFQHAIGQGRTRGQADLLRRLLTVRFGVLAPEVDARIAAASSDELVRFGERLLTATTLEQALDSP
jgi:hypothetical protein